ncbi:VOC family protein [Microcella alkalica]|uniref:Catechol 2,3-dioxygenase n=1 Tax=Microcella alkalica TaxID=355930 RepID=A0A839E8V9_9MICO|nr:VOC family protein [Microcella alkalica]MBA8849089.1 catechol 2,3-dioxygenase [Microcella alkalica]
MTTVTATVSAHERVLHPSTTMGAVTLHVGDLDGMTEFYASALALDVQVESAQGRVAHKVLGRGSLPLVRLVRTPGLPLVDPRKPGLFHTAFLLEDQASLAATAFRASRHPRGRFVGSSDHLVSEAFYFTDPEGNGIELYRDRDRKEWVHRNGQIEMATAFLDPRAYLEQHLRSEDVEAGSARAAAVGHVHLQVGDLAVAREFYIDVLGFELTQTGYPGALFASAGGYHHHIAMNTWNSRGAGPRAASLGLGDVSIAVPDQQELDAVGARLRARSLPFSSDGRSLTTADPWGTSVTLALPDPSAEEVAER